MFEERETLNPNYEKYVDKTIGYKLQYVTNGFTTIALANLIFRKKITHAGYYKRGGSCGQRPENQACISLNLETCQFCKGFTTQVVSLIS